jgi:hypothetical protein
MMESRRHTDTGNFTDEARAALVRIAHGIPANFPADIFADPDGEPDEETDTVGFIAPGEDGRLVEYEVAMPDHDPSIGLPVGTSVRVFGREVEITYTNNLHLVFAAYIRSSREAEKPLEPLGIDSYLADPVSPEAIEICSTLRSLRTSDPTLFELCLELLGAKYPSIVTVYRPSNPEGPIPSLAEQWSDQVESGGDAPYAAAFHCMLYAILRNSASQGQTTEKRDELLKLLDVKV